MNVFIFSPYATVVPHFETELEIAQQHLDGGDQVTFIECLGELENCDFNPSLDPERCQSCRGRRYMGQEMLTPAANRISFAQIEQRLLTNQEAADDVLPRLKTVFNSLEELIEYRIDDFDIGYAALSSLVSQCRDPEPDLIKHADLLQRFLRSAYRCYAAARHFLSQHQPDVVYLFNGRFAAMRAIFRAAEAVGVECKIHERGCDGQHYSLYNNHLPHDLDAIEKIIVSHWEAVDSADSADSIDSIDSKELEESRENRIQRERLAEQWYLDRVNRVEQSWHSFVTGQVQGKLPDNWEPNCHNVVLFNSSDDEFVAIGDCWKQQLYPNQVIAIEKLAAGLWHSHPQTRLTVRVHPNLKEIDNQRKQALMNLRSPNLRIIPADSAIDSYALIAASNWVVSFGSTVGIEATFWDRPSLLLGPSFYQNLGSNYRVESHQQAVDCLVRSLPPMPKIGALKYGYWRQTFGIPHRYFEASGLFEGEFKGQTLYERPPKKTLLRRLKSEIKNGLDRVMGRRHK